MKPLDGSAGFAPGDTVFYQVASATGSSVVHSFRVPAVGPNSVLTAVLTADMGASTVDQTSQHWHEPDAYATTANMYARVVNGTAGLQGGRLGAINAADAARFGIESKAAGTSAGKDGPGAQLAFCVGDLSYATGYLGKWETFMSAIEPVSSRVPYMSGQGNHEQDWPGSGTFATGAPLNGRDSGGECGVPTQQRFVMPNGSRDTPIPNPNAWAVPTWYSFDEGPVHFVMVNTELGSVGGHPTNGWYPGDAQFQWLQQDLAAVNRVATPWIIVMGHRPSFGAHPPTTPTAPNALETLLYTAKVDVTVAGHVHYAQLSCPFYQGKCQNVSTPGGYDAPVHIVAGNGGQGLNNASLPSQHFPYTGSGTQRPGGSEWGMSQFVVNSTTLVWQFVGNNDSQVHYTHKIERAYPRL